MDAEKAHLPDAIRKIALGRNGARTYPSVTCVLSMKTIPRAARVGAYSATVKRPHRALVRF